MLKLTDLMLIAALMTSMAAPAMAILHRDEPFDYPAGTNLDEQPNWNVPAVNTVVAGSLEYPGLLSTGNKIQIITRNVSTSPMSAAERAMVAEGTTTYVTFLGRDNHNVAIGGPNFIQFIVDPGSSGRLRLQSQSADTSPEDYEQSHFTTTLHQGNTIMWAARIMGLPGDDRIDVVINPDLSAGEPDWDNPDMQNTTVELNDMLLGPDLKVGSFSSCGRPGANPCADGNPNPFGQVDEIRIGTTWADVSPVPEPASLALLALGGMAMMRRRHQAM